MWCLMIHISKHERLPLHIITYIILITFQSRKAKQSQVVFSNVRSPKQLRYFLTFWEEAGEPPGYHTRKSSPRPTQLFSLQIPKHTCQGLFLSLQILLVFLKTCFPCAIPWGQHIGSVHFNYNTVFQRKTITNPKKRTLASSTQNYCTISL